MHHASAFSFAGAAAGSTLATGSISSGHLTGSGLTSTLAGWVRNHTSGGYFGFVGNETKGLYTYQKDTTTLSITYTKNTAPGAPRSVSAAAGNASAKVSFSAPSSDGGAAISKYTVTSSPGGKTATGYRQSDHGDRVDERHQLHVHGHGHQQRRHRAGLGRLQRRHPEGPGRRSGRRR